MREWNSDSDEQPNMWFWVEAAVVGGSVSLAYLLAFYFLGKELFEIFPVLFGASI